jgi:hypothetical protein
MGFTRRRFLGLTGLTTIAAGCRLQRPALPQHTYVLQLPPATTTEDGAAGSSTLLVRPFTVSAPYSSRAFVIRRGESEYVIDAYNAFLMSPGVLLTDAFAAWLRGLGRLAVVTTGGSQVVATHAMEGEISELYGDYRNTARPEAHLFLHLRLLHLMGGTNPTLQWQRDLRRSVVMSQAGAEELIAGWNQALSEICHAIEPELHEALAAR